MQPWELNITNPVPLDIAVTNDYIYSGALPRKESSITEESHKNVDKEEKARENYLL